MAFQNLVWSAQPWLRQRPLPHQTKILCFVSIDWVISIVARREQVVEIANALMFE